VYVPSFDSDSGQVLFLRHETLMAQPLDAHRLELSGEAVPVAEQVGSFLDYGLFSASGQRCLGLHQRCRAKLPTQMAGPSGKLLGSVGEPGGYISMALSPDGKRIAVSRSNPENTPNWDVWLLDAGRNNQHTLDARTDSGFVPCLVR